MYILLYKRHTFCTFKLSYEKTLMKSYNFNVLGVELKTRKNNYAN